MTDEEANALSSCGHGCYVIGGPYIAENPSCPVHGAENCQDVYAEIERLRAELAAAQQAQRAAENELSRRMASAAMEAGQLRAELAAANEHLQFIERWANHHGQKPSITPQEVLSVIQHYPPILAITRSYEDGKVPDTPNPWAELAAARDLLGWASHLMDSHMVAVEESDAEEVGRCINDISDYLHKGDQAMGSK